MPIIKELHLNDQVSMCIWKIEESEDQLLGYLNLNEAEFRDFDRTKLPAKRLEWLASRTALKHLVNDHGQFWMQKDEFGKPHFEGNPMSLSVSHANGYGAAAINLDGPVGVDIEEEREKIHRIAKKFLHRNESWAQGNTSALTKVWAGKEALYKLHGRTQLIFAEQLEINEPNRENQTSGMIHENGKTSEFQMLYGRSENLHFCCAF